jgi:SEC-C motif-containing protein
MATSPVKKQECPCGSGQTFLRCCGPYIAGDTSAPTAEALMRSRYSAYVTGDIDYIAKTHDPASIHEFDREAARNWAINTEWKGLEIVRTEDGSASDDTGTVEFIARFRTNDQEQTHHELSVFRREDKQWYYVDGKTVRSPIKRNSPKVGRNDPCPCGSGNKFKKCCADKAS